MKKSKFKRVSLAQRYQIEALLDLGLSTSQIAKRVGLHRSTVYREINRNSQLYGGHQMKYRYLAEFADGLAKCREKYKNKSIRLTDTIKRRIRWLIKCFWSPEQICLTCKKRNIPMVSTECIYLWLYALKRKGTDLCVYLRRHHRKRRKRRLDNTPRYPIKNRVSIEQRPNVVNHQKRIGDFETDLVKCTNGYLLTITDRKSLFNIIEPMKNKSSQTLLNTFIKAMSPFKNFAHTVTSDNGTEFTKHESIAKALNIKWYFAHPYSSQERGCNENQNGLIRQFASRKTDLKKTDYETIKLWQTILNHRPRKKLNMDKPINVFLNHSLSH